MALNQAVILCGGLGTRLGELTRATPKPLLPVAGRPFLEILISEVVRQGVEDVVLLAGFCADQVEEFVENSDLIDRLHANVSVIPESEPRGTGGALHNARDSLAETFLMLNGDSFFDFPLQHLARQLLETDTATGTMALRRIANPDRFGLAELAGAHVVRFADRETGLESGLINGGVYAFRRDRLLPWIDRHCSLETDILPSLAIGGTLLGCEFSGFFLDIGIPESYATAQIEIPELLSRPAVFFDRDGVLNHDYGHVGSVDRFDWIEGAREAIALCNRKGYLVFVVTNQAGVAHGFYSEPDVAALFQHMRAELGTVGAHIDDYRYCPHHPEAKVEPYRKGCNWRKPGSGMIDDLVAQWGVDASRSFLVGDNDSDIAAATTAGIVGHRYLSGSLLDFVEALIV